MKIKLLLISFLLATNALGAVAQVSKTYYVSKPGTLISMMTEEEANTVTHLTLTGAQIVKLEKRIRCLEDETEAILMERIRDRANAERYDRMIQKREEEIAAAKKQIEELQNISAVLRDRQTKLKRDISMIDDILAEGAMTEAHLRMLVEKIYVQETDGKLSLDIQIKAPFRTHLDVYENGTLTERYGALDFDWNRLARLLYGDGLAG